MREKFLGVIKSTWFVVAGSMVLGALIVLGIRFVAYHPEEEIHYHANFAVFIDGRQEKFQAPRYYQEVEMCQDKNTMSPGVRAHMHDNINNVIHVEDHAVTWGQFFSNIGWYLGPDFIQTADGKMYATSGNKQLHLMLNGQDYTGLGGLDNYVIKDRDKLLVSYGDVSQSDLDKEYKSIPGTARHYDLTKDPKSCAGHDGAGMMDRFKHMF